MLIIWIESVRSDLNTIIWKVFKLKDKLSILVIAVIIIGVIAHSVWVWQEMKNIELRRQMSLSELDTNLKQSKTWYKNSGK